MPVAKADKKGEGEKPIKDEIKSVTDRTKIEGAIKDLSLFKTMGQNTEHRERFMMAKDLLIGELGKYNNPEAARYAHQLKSMALITDTLSSHPAFSAEGGKDVRERTPKNPHAVDRTFEVTVARGLAEHEMTKLQEQLREIFGLEEGSKGGDKLRETRHHVGMR